ncbi:uncharacterized protein METZ01_LOCUS471278, partial [marine metagenome]
MDGEPVQHVGCRRVPQVRGLAETLHKAGLRTYEADLGYPRQYLIHRGLRGSVTIAGTWRKGQGVDRVYVEPDLAPSDWEPELHVLALDLETLPDASQILSCGFVNWGGDESVEEVHLLGDVRTNDPDHVYCHADERHLV